MAEEKQHLEDIPKNAQEYRRQKGRTPATAVWLGIGLIAACALFFGPAIVGAMGQH